MTAISTLWNHTATAANPLAPHSAKSAATPSDTTTTSTTASTGSDGSTISANDFLTLLVTEMKNQDPTAQTDPNEYINQLVQVNSLEQLININQTLTTSLGTSPGSPISHAVAGRVNAPYASATATSTPAADNISVAHVRAAASAASIQTPVSPVVPGNLTPPAAMPAAQRIARALSGHN
jgi:flagellar basal-body rod modification protein FlgD